MLQLRIGAVAALILLLFGFVSIVWTPYPVGGLNISGALLDPSGAHWLGTDELGRDVLSLLMKGVLTSFVVSAVALVIGAILGGALGLGAALFGGVPAQLMLRTGDFAYAFSALVIALLLAAAFGPGAANTMVAVGLFSIPAFARPLHDAFVHIRSQGYVDAARLAGLGGMDLWRRHFVAELIRLLVALAIEQLAIGVLAEAAFAFIGIGTAAPATSLGLLLHDAQLNAVGKPALILVPGIALLLIVLALNAAARGLRRLLDPATARFVEGHGVA